MMVKAKAEVIPNSNCMTLARQNYLSLQKERFDLSSVCLKLPGTEKLEL